MMTWEPVMMLVTLGFSLVVAGLVGFSLFIYIRNNWWAGRLGDGEGDTSHMLDGIDRIEVRLTAMAERLDRLERRLGSGDDGGGRPDPEAARRPPPDES